MGRCPYLFGRGDGQDLIQSHINDRAAGKLNILQFKEGVQPSDLVLKRIGSNYGPYTSLEVSIAGTADKITIEAFYYLDSPHTGYNPVQRFQFADGTSWDLAAITGKTLISSNADDLLVGTTASEVISGGLGNDSIAARDGDDRLEGGAGNDTLNGQEGNDVLDGGEGNDVLSGGNGNDTYIFAAGYGQDVINNMSNTPADNDILSIEGITHDNLWLSRQGVSLVIDVRGSEDRVTVQDWYANSAQRLDAIQAGGSNLYANQVDNLVIAMAGFGAPAGGEINLSQVQRDQLNAVIAANWQ